jgi:hypothetical protein
MIVCAEVAVFLADGSTTLLLFGGDRVGCQLGSSWSCTSRLCAGIDRVMWSAACSQLTD